jgi:ankyrin repeat protein
MLLTRLLIALAIEGDGTTALHRAAHRDDTAEGRRLIAAGADVNAANDLGVTPLWEAALNGSTEFARMLLDKGANPNAALVAGETPLMVAARGGMTDVVALLLAKGANPNARATRGQTALMWAVSQKHPGTVKALLEGKADVHAVTETWKQMMAVPPHGYLPYNREIPHGKYTALLFAARTGDLESAKLLLAAGADANDEDAWGVSALTLAAHSGFSGMAELLLAKGADPSAMRAGFSAMHTAIMRRDEALVRELLARGADANAPVKAWTPVRRSARDWYFPPQAVGATPLWLAARLQEPGIMRALIAKGADARFVHQAEYVVEKGFKKRFERATIVQAARGAIALTAWMPARQAAREEECVKIAVEAGATP